MNPCKLIIEIYFKRRFRIDVNYCSFQYYEIKHEHI